MTEASPKPLYRCKKCNTVTPKPSHHAMTWCECGAVGVDHGWYGSRVLWKGEPGEAFDDVAEIASQEAAE